MIAGRKVCSVACLDDVTDHPDLYGSFFSSAWISWAMNVKYRPQFSEVDHARAVSIMRIVLFSVRCITTCVLVLVISECQWFCKFEIMSCVLDFFDEVLVSDIVCIPWGALKFAIAIAFVYILSNVLFDIVRVVSFIFNFKLTGFEIGFDCTSLKKLVALLSIRLLGYFAGNKKMAITLHDLQSNGMFRCDC